MTNHAKLGITEVVLRDAHQSLLATRLRLDDMLPIAEKLDNVGYWALETWGGATFDACIRYLGEDPWQRLRALKQAMPKTRQQMLLRGQNLLGYRHYADDLVEKFVARACHHGIDVFRIFDALNDPRNIRVALQAVKKNDRHAQGTLCYTLSPVHHLQGWVDLAREIEDMGADSICIKDMAGLLKPYAGFELVTALKKAVKIPIHLHCHATTGVAHATLIKCIEAGVDNVDTAISSMSMTYGHSPTETLVASLQETPFDTGLDIHQLDDIAHYFRAVRLKYAAFEGVLKTVDTQIFRSQVPGGMLTNLEMQLKEQNALDKLEHVMAEIPRVRKDLGYVPLVTPCSQIVATQAVFNVLLKTPYAHMTQEVCGLLKGEYGRTPAPVNTELQTRILNGESAINTRPADALAPELEKLSSDLRTFSQQHPLHISSGEDFIDDVLTFALFPQIGLTYFLNRQNSTAFEPVPNGEKLDAQTNHLDVETPKEAVYTVTLDNKSYTVTVNVGGNITGIKALTDNQISALPVLNDIIKAPLAGLIGKCFVQEGQKVVKDQPLLRMEAMKMEIIVTATRPGVVKVVHITKGATVAASDALITLSNA